MAHSSHKCKMTGKFGVGHLNLGYTRRRVRPLPTRKTAAGFVDVTTDGSLIRVNLVSHSIIMIGFELLTRCNIDFSLVFSHQLVPAAVTDGIGRIWIADRVIGLLPGELRIDR